MKHVKDPPVDSHGVDPVKHVKDKIGPGPGDPPDKDDPHHVNKALVGLGALAFGRLCYLGEKLMILFSPLLGEFFNQERRHEKDKKPSIFAKK